jgi:mRNA interferase RelE/StbE
VPYSIAILPAALRVLATLPTADKKRLSRKIDQLAQDPRPPGTKRLRGKREYLRLRSGNYRVIYTVEDDRQMVLVVKVGHRREIYGRL